MNLKYKVESYVQVYIDTSCKEQSLKTITEGIINHQGSIRKRIQHAWHHEVPKAPELGKLAFLMAPLCTYVFK